MIFVRNRFADDHQGDPLDFRRFDFRSSTCACDHPPCNHFSFRPTMLLSTLPLIAALFLPLLSSAQLVPGPEQVPAKCMTSCYRSSRSSAGLPHSFTSKIS
jgi:hypothetical protein